MDSICNISPLHSPLPQYLPRTGGGRNWQDRTVTILQFTLDIILQFTDDISDIILLFTDDIYL